jgi:NhaP-type Na+/H+ and K+/H+ antiporter
MLLASSAGDNVFAIVLFGVFTGFYAGGGGAWPLQLARIPVSLLLGVLLGGAAGFFWHAVFRRFSLSGRKVLLLVGTAVLMTALEDSLAGRVPVAGLLAVMTMGFVLLEKSEAAAHRISDILGRFWVFAEILLFVLVGAQVDVHVAWQAGLAGSAVIAAGLVFRSLGVRLALLGSPLTGPEKLFTTVAYLPKATVQAAIGAIPLSLGVPGGDVILAVAVLSILLTAPAGAVATLYCGNRFLAVETPPR